MPEVNSDLGVDVLLRAVFGLFQVSLIEVFEVIVPWWMSDNVLNTAQKMKFSIKDFFSKCDSERDFLYSERDSDTGFFFWILQKL